MFFLSANMNTLDVDRFIIEIEDRPASWDVRCNNYSNKIAKAKAWHRKRATAKRHGVATTAWPVCSKHATLWRHGVAPQSGPCAPGLKK